MKRLSCLIFLALALNGCALFESRADRALRNSPDYRAGYADGCGTAGSSDARHDGTRRDDAAFESNRAYRSGFRAGMGACRAMEGRGVAGGSNLGQMINPGAP